MQQTEGPARAEFPGGSVWGGHQENHKEGEIGEVDIT